LCGIAPPHQSEFGSGIIPASIICGGSRRATIPKRRKPKLTVVCDCKGYWTKGFCAHERLVRHLESDIDLDELMGGFKVNKKRGLKRRTAPALIQQGVSPQPKKKKDTCVLTEPVC